MIQQEDIRKAVEVLQKGGVILYPTDTVWRRCHQSRSSG